MQEVPILKPGIEDFIPVKSRKKRRGGQAKSVGVSHHPKTVSNFWVGDNGEFSPTNEQIIKKLNAALMHLETSGYFASFNNLLHQCVQTLDPLGATVVPTKIVCFGLGKFSDCIIARYQLALLLLLRKSFGIGAAEIFDPVFSQQEHDILSKELNLQVLTENEGGKRSVANLTLFYLPHCSHQLVNNLLFANWEREKLKNCVIICNSFCKIREGVLPRVLSESLSFISMALEFCDEFDVKNEFQYSDIFNDTAIHVFLNSKLPEKNHNIWLNIKTPMYEDAEFVQPPS